MDALILSCSTGGGHNAAGTAIKEELEVRGHHVTMMDPYELVSHKLAEEVGNIYVKMVQHSPKLFGFVYSLGGIVRNIPGKSPVYYANIRVAKKLRQYLQKSPADVILMPHLYPAELVTYLKKKGEKDDIKNYKNKYLHLLKMNSLIEGNYLKKIQQLL